MKCSWKRNSSFPTSFIETHWYIPFHFLQPGRIAVPFVKRSSSSYKQTFTIFSREKALFQSGFPLFKPQLLPSGLPSAYDLSGPFTIQFPLWPLRFPHHFHRRLPSDSNCWKCLVGASVIRLCCPFLCNTLLQRSMGFSLHTTLVHYPLNWDVRHLKFLTIMINPQGASLVHPGDNSWQKYIGGRAILGSDGKRLLHRIGQGFQEPQRRRSIRTRKVTTRVIKATERRRGGYWRLDCSTTRNGGWCKGWATRAGEKSNESDIGWDSNQMAGH